MKRGLVGVLACALGLVAAGADAGVEEKGRDGSWKDDARKRHFAERLGVTESQAEKLQALFKERKKAVRPLRRELRDGITKLRDQVEDEAGDEAIQATLDRVGKAREAMRSEKDRFQKRIAEILPPTQRAKLLMARGRMMKLRSMRGGRGPGFHGKGGRHGRRGQLRIEEEGGGKMRDGLNGGDDEADDEGAED